MAMLPSKILKTEGNKCCSKHTVLLKMAFETDVPVDVDCELWLKRYLFSCNSETLSGCAIIQEVNNWLWIIWPGHCFEHWVNNFFTCLTVYGDSFTSDMNQFVHPLEPRVPHMVWSWNLHQTKNVDWYSTTKYVDLLCHPFGLVTHPNEKLILH